MSEAPDRQSSETHDSDRIEAAIAELRSDIAALWIAFAQQERRLNALPLSPTAAESQPEPATAADPADPPVPAATERAPQPAADPQPEAVAPPAGSEAERLADLDAVLAAIERATDRLSRDG